jgi:hypothetical protein
LLGAKTIELTARSAWSSLTGAKFAPPSIERQTPPVEEPASTTRASAGETATALMRPLVAPHFDVVEVGFGPTGVHTCLSTEDDDDALLGLRGRDSQALRRDSAGTESKGYARLNMNQLARPSLSSSNSDAAGADARPGAGVKSARVLFKRATAPRLTLRRAPERFRPAFVSEATALEGRRVVRSCAADGLSAAHIETANRRQIRSAGRRGLRVARRDDEAERFFMGYYFGGVKASRLRYEGKLIRRE